MPNFTLTHRLALKASPDRDPETDPVFDDFVRSFAATQDELAVLTSNAEISSLNEARQYVKMIHAKRKAGAGHVTEAA